MTPRHLVMGAAVLAAAGLLVFGDNKPEPDVAEAVERSAPRAVAARTSAVANPVAAPAEPAILRLAARDTLIGDDDAFGPGVFGSQNLNPPPAAPPVDNTPPPPPPPPSAPPLPFVFIGKAVGEGAWEVFLARGDKTYIVRNKMVIDGVYRVDAIAPPTLTLTYLPLNQVQQLNIGVFD
ncbi:hypothetical protein INH39_20485 [Massilia violaceinigra]|uniref:Secretion system X translation initiation factor n=1 Tax=Massilia violaceinigra TaxID=2045208 RepID=A0ABY4A120_9BURK|nr:hypothetical protein [Massilia violaceinigra]UOD27855.1 hypothetical protein INH39_20485 [Massilia violaceinigra]